MPTMIKISYINPKTKQKLVSQVVRPVTIGRSSDCDIQITWEPSVSRYHVVVLPRMDGRIEVRDLASSAGTFVVKFGQRQRLLAVAGDKGFEAGRATLFEGDTFYAGLVKFDVEHENLPGEETIDWSITEPEEITGQVDLKDVE